MNETRNLAARAGRWSAQHRKKAIFGWLAFVIAAVFIGGSVGTKTLTDDDYGTGESGRADAAINRAFPDEANESVLVQPRNGGNARDAESKAAVSEVVARLEQTKHVKDIESPYAKGNEGQISKDGRSALVNFEIAGENADERVGPVLNGVAAVQKDHPSLRVEQFGDASAEKALSKAFEDDFKRAEITSLPITIIILIVAFGALVAASVPLLLAITAVAAAIGLIGPISQIWAVDEAISSVVLLIGLAVGVDYSMFYLRREREERAKGLSEEAALEAAAATSGRAVLVSGITVMIAMGGMYLAGAPTFLSFATGTILVVAIAMIGSLTVLPAVLSKLGDRVNKGRIPFLRPERRTGEPRAWSWLLDRVLARPVVSALAATAVLVVLAIPALGMHTANTGVDGLPRDLPVMQTYDRIQAAFPGGPLPASIVVRGDDVTSGAAQADIRELRSELAAFAGAVQAAGLGQREPGQDARRRERPVRGQRHRRPLKRGARRAAGRRPAGDPGEVRQPRPGRRDRHDRGIEGLQRPDQGARAVRVRVRLRARVPAAARDLPVDRDPDQGDPAEPAVGRGRLRDPHLDLPGGSPAVAARVRVHRARSRPGCRCSCS